jgi:hypothetical protein
MTRRLLERGDPGIRTFVMTTDFDIAAFDPDCLDVEHEHAYLCDIARQWSKNLSFTPGLPQDVLDFVMRRPPVLVVYWPQRTCSTTTYPLGCGEAEVTHETVDRLSPYAQLNSPCLHVHLQQSDDREEFVNARVLYDTGPDDPDERFELERGCSYRFYGQLEAHADPCSLGSVIWFKCGIVRLP